MHKKNTKFFLFFFVFFSFFFIHLQCENKNHFMTDFLLDKETLELLFLNSLTIAFVVLLSVIVFMVSIGLLACVFSGIKLKNKKYD